MSRVLFKLQSEVIRLVARREDAVIIGRCSDVILRDIPEVKLLSVFIAAPFESRVSRKMELERMDQKKAAAMVQKMDKQRSQYYESYTGMKWGEPQRYDLYLDSSQLGFEEIISEIVRTYHTM